MKQITHIAILAAFLLPALSCSQKAVMEVAEAPVVNYHPDPWTFLPMETTFVGNGNHRVTAGFDDTKSHLVMNGAGTHASVEWTKDDEILMIDQSFCYTTYTAATDGAEVEFTGGESLSGSPLYTIYPSSALEKVAFDDGKFYLGAFFPNKQTATPGSVAEEANVSFVRVNSQEDRLSFQNVTSLLKFRLSGDIVDQIKSVTFNGTSILSGTLVIDPDNHDGVPFIQEGAFFSGCPQYSSVTLSGNFAAATDYYIALSPGVQNGFSMVFSNADGSQVIRKFSSKCVTFNRSRITDFGTINLGSSFDPADAVSKLYIQHNEAVTTKYATIAVLPDGYTADQLADYELDARSAIDALFNTEPYKSYRDYFNVWILKVASRESGARIYDGTAEEQNLDCYFQSTWERTQYSHMHANADRVFSFVEQYCPDVISGVHTKVEVPVLLIINDGRYGGIAQNYANGMTYCMAPRARSYGAMAWSYPSVEAASVDALPEDTHAVTNEEKTAMATPNEGDWRNVVVHEFGGHSIGKLGDEYWYDTYLEAVNAIASHTWYVPMSLNVSAKSDPALTPWAELFDEAIRTKMATISPLYAERISVFQGAAVSMFNRWRSERISCMIDNRFYFSTWQRYIIVNRIMTLAGLPSISINDFLDHDVPTDPNRDNLGSQVMLPDGVTRTPPHPMPMLPPPVWHDDL